MCIVESGSPRLTASCPVRGPTYDFATSPLVSPLRWDRTPCASVDDLDPSLTPT